MEFGFQMYDSTPYVIIGKSIMPLETLISLEERMAATPPPTDAEEDDPSLIGTFADVRLDECRGFYYIGTIEQCKTKDISSQI